MLGDVLLGNYKKVADKLGLTIDGGYTAGRLRIYGIVDGVLCQQWFGAHSTHTSAQLLHPAPMELSVVTRGLLDKLAELFGKEHRRLGDPSFDDHLLVKCADVPRLGELLTPAVRAQLVELAKAGLHPAVDAHTVHLRRFSNGGTDSEDVIERDFQETARLVRALAPWGEVGP